MDEDPWPTVTAWLRGHTGGEHTDEVLRELGLSRG